LAAKKSAGSVERSARGRAPTGVSPPELALLSPLIAGPASGARDEVELELVARLRRGERAAVGQVYEAHHQAVRAFARRLVGEDSAAEDVVHDTFVMLPRAIRRFRGEAALRSFLIGVAINQARRHVRSAVRRRRAHERSGAAEAVAAAGRDARHEAMQRALAARLVLALDELPLEQRVAFVLCEVEQRSSVEAAAIVGVAEGTVRTRLFHARKKLRAALGEDGP
jgi:RNA polymerase sigma-70 factor (ECF subfamily)